MALVDRTGLRYGRLTVISRVDNTPLGLARWFCRCDCGVESVVTGGNLGNGNTQSCGCFARDMCPPPPDATIHGQWGTGTYWSWAMMKQRVTNPLATGWANYGGRGIDADPRWLVSFETFLADMGERPVGTSIDRIDNDSGYWPGNCRWATRSEQNNNRRPARRRLSPAAGTSLHPMNEDAALAAGLLG